VIRVVIGEVTLEAALCLQGHAHRSTKSFNSDALIWRSGRRVTWLVMCRLIQMQVHRFDRFAQGPQLICFSCRCFSPGFSPQETRAETHQVSRERQSP